MKILPNGSIKRFGKTAVAAFVFGTLLLVAGTPRALADDCQKRINRADHRLHEAAEHHGWNSPEADRARHELHDAREWCWEHGHRWWDADEHRWHTERDWNDHDHDRDHH